LDFKKFLPSILKLALNLTVAIALEYSSFSVEHILSLLSAFAGAMVCQADKAFYQGFVTHFYPWVFDVLPYSAALGAMTQVCTLFLLLLISLVY
jgi:hypothetical protein